MNKVHELLGYERIKILQNDEAFSFSLDSMLLANFVETKNAKNIIDLGTGNAPIPLFLTLKTNAKIVGVEIQKVAYDLATKSVQLNSFENQISIINDDYKDIYKKLGANSFDICISNPPYFKVKEDSIVNEKDTYTIARHEVKGCVKSVITEAKKLLIDGGYLYIVHRVERLSEIFKYLEENNFGIKRLQFIYPKVNKDAYMFLIEARKNKKTDIKIINPIIVSDEMGNYTEEVLKIFNFKKN